MEQFNPLTAQCDAKREALASLRSAADDLDQELAWNDTIDLEAVQMNLSAERAAVTSCDVRLGAIAGELAKAKAHVEKLRPAARMGANPLHWFSDARTKAQHDMRRTLGRMDELKVEHATLLDERQVSLRHEADAVASLKRHAEFDRSAAANQVADLQREIQALAADVDRVCARAAAIDEEMAAPLKEYTANRRRAKDSQDDLDRATRLSRKLGEASNSYERAMIRQECKQRFGDGSPSRAIARLEKELTGINRDAEKLERRLRDIGRRGSLEVESLVLDGSNLCYEGDKLIGLFALRALGTRLATDYKVTIIFDASIRGKLGLPSDDTLRSQLPDVSVHVGAPGTSADETILDIAVEPTSFVISNDRFADFPDKPAVRESRIIRHEIVDGRVLIRDLNIDLQYRNQN